MNAQLKMTAELDNALRNIKAQLPGQMRIKLDKHKAKLIIIDGEVWFIDLEQYNGTWRHQ